MVEAGGGVGGTWYWNRYPGARCDVESLEYSYRFSEELQQEWEWSERYASQPEILSYLNHVADRFDLRRDIQFDTRVAAADVRRGDDRGRSGPTAASECRPGSWSWRPAACRRPTSPTSPAWTPSGARVSHRPLAARPVDFTGTAGRCHRHRLLGCPVDPGDRPAGRELFVFQRTATYSVPGAQRAADRRGAAGVKADYAGFRGATARSSPRSRMPLNDASRLWPSSRTSGPGYEERWQQGGSVPRRLRRPHVDQQANDTAADSSGTRSARSWTTRRWPSGWRPKVIGCKRLCVDTGYYDTFNRDNVTLVDLSAAPIERSRRAGCGPTAGSTNSTASCSPPASTP